MLATQLMEQMGRPKKGCLSEVSTAIVRGKFLISVAKESLGDVVIEVRTYRIARANFQGCH